uniref:Uncharacterized protein n=1 Tax=Glossina palpalis gambiensis TaxID=67801 RepID=A0A1B0C4N3_9MUSC
MYTQCNDSLKPLHKKNNIIFAPLLFFISSNFQDIKVIVLTDYYRYKFVINGSKLFYVMIPTESPSSFCGGLGGRHICEKYDAKIEKLKILSTSHKFCLNYSDLVINAIAAFAQFLNLPCQCVNGGLSLVTRSTSYNWRERYLSKRRSIFQLKRGTTVFGSRPKKKVSSGSSSTSSPFSSGASNLSSLLNN